MPIPTRTSKSLTAMALCCAALWSHASDSPSAASQRDSAGPAPPAYGTTASPDQQFRNRTLGLNFESATAALVTETPASDTTENRFDIWSTFNSRMAFAPYHGRPGVSESLGDARAWGQLLAHTRDQATLYLPYVTRRLVEGGLPPELALLPFVESAYDPLAQSPGGAAGLWQFTRATADHLGLKYNPWYDGRKDIVRSTDAAVIYLQHLNRRFEGDWLLSLAAYNSGEGRVARAIKANLTKGKSTDFWSLDLPPTTRAYVPKLLALAKLFRDGEAHQYLAATTTNDLPQHALETLVLPEQISLRRAAELANLDYEVLKSFNTGLKNEVTPPQGPHRLVLPQPAAQRFLAALALAERSTRRPARAM